MKIGTYYDKSLIKMYLKVKNKKIDIRKIKAIIFDMDGTLVESEHIWAFAKQKIAEAEGIKINKDELEKYIGRGLNDFIDEILKPQSAAHRTKINQKIQKKALENYDANIHVIDGATNLLEAFQSAGIKIAICSSGPIEAIQSSLSALKATEMIDVIVSGETLSIGKPDPLPYLHTLMKLKLEPSEVIVFEDTISGLKSASSAGIQTIIVGNQAKTQEFNNAILIEPYLKNFNLTET
jgi:HAD superfamily hydrolase (TIGR01509 family)